VIRLTYFVTAALAALWLGFIFSLPSFAQEMGSSTKPNILVIMGDDIGYWNISAYNRGMMGYHTPNIDRIADEGGIFTDYYGQQSCTAGRAAFITGQSPMRTGLLKVGLPGAKEGLSEKDPTLADLLKPLGYVTGQFGKNHLGDRNEFLPTVHGFDEFFGNLYHLNAEDEPEQAEYPKNTEFKQRFGPRGVLRCTATTTDTPGDDPRFGKWGKQNCEDTGPLDKKRMETVDDEFLKATLNFIDRAHRDKKPFFAWFNSTRMHIWTRLKPESQGKTGLGLYPDGMVEHDGQVGQLLKKLDDLGIANNTIVIYTTDNGAETFTWPDGGTTPFRGEKNTNWGRAAIAYPHWCAGPVSCDLAPRSMTSSPRRTGYRLWWQQPASQISRISSCMATTQAARTSRCTSTATTSATC
jgi:arylsulfatase A-like enzyme